MTILKNPYGSNDTVLNLGVACEKYFCENFEKELLMRKHFNLWRKTKNYIATWERC